MDRVGLTAFPHRLKAWGVRGRGERPLGRKSMAISRWDPLQELVALQERMNRMFDVTLSRSRGEEQQEMTAGSWTPPIDIYETGDRLVLRADLPGLRQEDIEV